MPKKTPVNMNYNQKDINRKEVGGELGLSQFQ
jgi:hypothetical protein